MGGFPGWSGFSLDTNVTVSVFFLFYSAAHLLFRLHFEPFYLVLQVKITHYINVIKKTQHIVDLYILVIQIFEYTHSLKTCLNIKIKCPPPSPEHVLNHSLVFPVFRGLSGISGLFGK